MKLSGLEIRDAKTPLTIKVTDKHAKKGKGKNPRLCPGATCIKETKVVEDVRVHLGRTYIKFHDNPCWTRYVTPTNMRPEIIAVDRGGKFTAGSYTLEVPKKLKKSKSGAVGGRNKSSGKHRKVKMQHYTYDVRPRAL